jgi:hypothetical protein
LLSTVGRIYICVASLYEEEGPLNIVRRKEPTRAEVGGQYLPNVVLVLSVNTLESRITTTDPTRDDRFEF